ncbi:MAG: terpene cyclase/mutase family protein [Planctomycetes bacterium]|nr:terpene cyclase/mutase family protein [Planctomycetota bacterium]
MSTVPGDGGRATGDAPGSSRPPSPVARRPGWRDRIERSRSTLLSLVSHGIWIALVLLFYPAATPDEEEIRIPIQIHVPGVEGNTDDEQADDDVAPKEEAAAPTEEEVPQAEERKRDQADEPSEEQVIGYAEQGPASPPIPPVEEDLDDKEVLDALDRVSRLASRVAPAYSHRNSDGRRDGIGRYGGSEDTEAAVELGLAWLAAHQSADGRWDSNHFNHLCPSPGERCSGSGLMSYDAGQTGLAVLAFLGAGYAPKRGSYGDEVSRGIDFLLQEQKEDGVIGNGDLYNHSIALLALAEAYGMTRDPRLKRAVTAGARYLQKAQQPSGGWTYTTSPRQERNDSSITGFVIQALKAAYVAGIRFPDDVFAGAVRHYRRMTDPDTGAVTYADQGPQFTRQGEGLVAVGLLCRLLLGEPRDGAALRRAVVRVASNPPSWAERESIDNSDYYWYYGTLAMFQVGGSEWGAWNRAMVRAIVPHQRRSGHAAGSWDPDGKWGPNGGRLYSTSINILTLEVYYKYAPEYLKEVPDLARFWLEPVREFDPAKAAGGNPFGFGDPSESKKRGK